MSRLSKWILTFWKCQSLENSRKLEDFEQNKAHLLKILLNNPVFFLFPKFLESFFTPKNTPPKVKNSKLDKRCIFFGTPCRLHANHVKVYCCGCGGYWGNKWVLWLSVLDIIVSFSVPLLNQKPRIYARKINSPM